MRNENNKPVTLRDINARILKVDKPNPVTYKKDYTTMTKEVYSRNARLI